MMDSKDNDAGSGLDERERGSHHQQGLFTFAFCPLPFDFPWWSRRAALLPNPQPRIPNPESRAFHTSNLYFSALRYSVRRSMPRISEVFTLLPPVTFKTCAR